jgi:hypothetical protein
MEVIVNAPEETAYSRRGTHRHRCRCRVGPAPSRDSNVRGQKRRYRNSLLLGRWGSRTRSASTTRRQNGQLRQFPNSETGEACQTHRRFLERLPNLSGGSRWTNSRKDRRTGLGPFTKHWGALADRSSPFEKRLGFHGGY